MLVRSEKAECLTRGQFLRSTWQALWQAWAGLLGELAAGDEESKEGWELLGPAEGFRRPRLTAIKGTPIVVALGDRGARSYLALCPQDGGPLQWLVAGEILVCLSCARQYRAQTGREEEGAAELVSLPTKVVAEHIWVNIV